MKSCQDVLMIPSLCCCSEAWQVYHDRWLLLRSFWSFVLPVLEYCSAVWCSAADSHHKLQDRVVRTAGILAGGVLQSNLANCRSVAELCLLFKITFNPMDPLSGALPLPFVPARVTRGALVAHRHSFATPRCRTSQYRRTFVPQYYCIISPELSLPTPNSGNTLNRVYQREEHLPIAEKFNFEGAVFY